MCIQDDLFFLDASDNVNVAIWNEDGFGVIWQIIEVVEFLYFIGLGGEIKEVAMGFLDGENGYFLDILIKVIWNIDVY